MMQFLHLRLLPADDLALAPDLPSQQTGSCAARLHASQRVTESSLTKMSPFRVVLETFPDHRCQAKR